MTQETRNIEYPIYEDFIQLNVEEITQIALWAETNYPDCKFKLSRDMCVAKINNYDEYGLCESPINRLMSLNICKSFEEDMDDTVFIADVFEHHIFSEKGPIKHYLAQLSLYLIELANRILPATTGLNPKSRVFEDSLVNDARE